MSTLLFTAALLLIAYAGYCLYMRSVKKRCSCTADLTGKTVIVTGSDKGEWVNGAFLTANKCMCDDGCFTNGYISVLFYLTVKIKNSVPEICLLWFQLCHCLNYNRSVSCKMFSHYASQGSYILWLGR